VLAGRLTIDSLYHPDYTRKIPVTLEHHSDTAGSHS
jgi:hypothetical protein